MTSARSYKEASASDAARDELARCAGTQFDPRVVRAFMNVSLGRLRLVMGPLFWLAHAPLLGRLPLTPAIGTAAASLATVAAAVTTGFAGPPPTPSFASALPTGAAEESAVRHVLERVTQEDQRAVIGMSEAAIIPGHSAIANAVFNACGVRVREMPLTPDKVLMGLAEQARGGGDR